MAFESRGRLRRRWQAETEKSEEMTSFKKLNLVIVKIRFRIEERSSDGFVLVATAFEYKDGWKLSRSEYISMKHIDACGGVRETIKVYRFAMTEKLKQTVRNVFGETAIFGEKNDG